MRVFFRDERGRRELVILREPRSGAVIADPSLAQAIAAVRGMRRCMGPNGPVYGGEYEDDLPSGAEFWQAMSESEQWRFAEAKGRSYLLRDPGDWERMWADALSR